VPDRPCGRGLRPDRKLAHLLLCEPASDRARPEGATARRLAAYADLHSTCSNDASPNGRPYAAASEEADATRDRETHTAACHAKTHHTGASHAELPEANAAPDCQPESASDTSVPAADTCPDAAAHT
jgi:hypothetical protein